MHEIQFPAFHSNPGFTLVALLVIVAVLAILAAMLLPALASAKKKAQRINCVNNLKQCGLAFRIWEGDNSDKYPMAVPMAKGGTQEFNTGADTFRHFQVMSNELSTPKILVCPADTRTAAKNFVRLKNQNVSYFVGLEANDANPQTISRRRPEHHRRHAPQNGILKLVPGGPVGWTPPSTTTPAISASPTAACSNTSNSGLARLFEKFRRSRPTPGAFRPAGIRGERFEFYFCFEIRRFPQPQSAFTFGF